MWRLRDQVPCEAREKSSRCVLLGCSKMLRAGVGHAIKRATPSANRNKAVGERRFAHSPARTVIEPALQSPASKRTMATAGQADNGNDVLQHGERLSCFVAWSDPQPSRPRRSKSPAVEKHLCWILDYWRGWGIKQSKSQKGLSPTTSTHGSSYSIARSWQSRDGVVVGSRKPTYGCHT